MNELIDLMIREEPMQPFFDHYCSCKTGAAVLFCYGKFREERIKT
jgi:hypothetical protein